jgi:hypothetical protein
MAGQRSGRSRWISILLMIGTPASAVDRARLDRCEAQLGACYESCKARASPKACNEKCTTGQCGLPWKESYGAFIDRRIEETAARTRYKFIGLNRMTRQRRIREHPEDPGPAGDLLWLFGLR